jgi:hypothetical protein
MHLNPRKWSSQVAKYISVLLIFAGICCFLMAFALESRGRKLSGVRLKHTVERNLNGYFQRPLGADLGERNYIREEQAETYFRYKRYRQTAGYSGMALLLGVVAIAASPRGVGEPGEW